MRPRNRGRLRAWATGAATLLMVAGTAAAAPAPREADDLSPEIRAIMDKPAYQHAQWGLLEIDPESGKVIHSRFPDQFFIPASNAKEVTESAAWHVLGPDSTFTTPVQAIGNRSGSTLDGNLALVAQGDLTMGGRTKPDGTVDYTTFDHTYADSAPGAILTPEDPLAGIDQLAQQVHDAGITQVNGDVVVDARKFTPPALDPLPTPLIINDNLIDLLSTPTSPGQPAALTWRPQVAPYQVTSTVRTVAAGGPTDIRVSASPDGTQISLSGTIAADAQPAVKVSPVRDPNAFGRTALIEALARAGVTVSAAPTGANPVADLPASYDGTDRVAAYVSPPYREYAKLILKVSHNLGANLALCNLATSRGSTDCDDGYGLIHSFLTDVAHVDPTQFQLNDGRGGDPADRATPRGLDQLFAYWLHTPDADAFRLAQPILGVDGTLAGSCNTDACPARGKVFAKTGSAVGGDPLNQQLAVGAQTLGGYLVSDQGCMRIFFLAVNGAAVPDIPGFVQVGNDLARIAALLQQEASADRPRT
ncbi:D-alanyl-D-alanine carboxypeptidase/D-alanyl-D-alanine endopeptidase [Kitasatospora sp. LaBMicrA B282]|uniref:D-alanyl-D-alanine carboxypeptidase/D-alanyl-D-alanine endopeptidase n=1 Tax=Kitasatospora sp. LaBMicrA B282 TaxID=3420949 RepID=UPI003D1100A7